MVLSRLGRWRSNNKAALQVGGPPNRVAMRVTGGLLFLGFCTLLMLVATSPPRFLYDEPFHADTVLLLHQHGLSPRFLKSLPTASGPLYSFVQFVFEPLTRLQPVRMRLVNVFLLALVSGILVSSLNRQRQTDHWVAGCSALIVPMTWVVAGMALSEMPAIVFVTLSLYLQLRALAALEAGHPIRGWFLVSGFCLGIAVWGRQPYLLLCGVPVLVGILERRLRMAAAIFVGIVLAMAIPLFVIWNGLVPPDSQDLVLLGVSVPHGLLSLGYAGICFFLIAPEFRYLPLKVLFGLLMLTIAANASLDIMVSYPIQSLADRYFPTSMLSLYGSVSGSLLLSCGLVFLAALLRMIWLDRKDLSRVTIIAGLLCIAIAPMFDTFQYSSRYTAMSLPYLIMAAQAWRRWRLETPITAALGCVLGFLSLLGYFSGNPSE
jgi:hypothetical protein